MTQVILTFFKYCSLYFLSSKEIHTQLNSIQLSLGYTLKRPFFNSEISLFWDVQAKVSPEEGT